MQIIQFHMQFNEQNQNRSKKNDFSPQKLWFLFFSCQAIDVKFKIIINTHFILLYKAMKSIDGHQKKMLRSKWLPPNNLGLHRKKNVPLKYQTQLFLIFYCQTQNWKEHEIECPKLNKFNYFFNTIPFSDEFLKFFAAESAASVQVNVFFKCKPKLSRQREMSKTLLNKRWSYTCMVCIRYKAESQNDRITLCQTANRKQSDFETTANTFLWTNRFISAHLESLTFGLCLNVTQFYSFQFYNMASNIIISN